MSLKSDIKEAIELWQGSSVLFKFFLVLSTFLATSSIASLADAVFSWKGFILDGIEFYRAFVVETFQDLFAELEINYTRVSIDYLVVCSLAVSGLSRNLFSVDNKTIETLLILLLPVSALMFAFYSLANVSRSPSIFSFLGVVVIYTAIPFVFKDDRKTKLAHFAPLAVAMILVLTLGAINAGITR